MHMDRARTIIDVLGEMGHDAQGLGDRDLAIGMDNLRLLAKAAKFPFICSNLLDAESKQPVFEAHIVKDLGGVKVGVFGLMSADFPRSDGIQRENHVEIADMTATAKAQVAALRAQGAQAIVVLAHASIEECQKLGEEVPGITAFLGTSSQQMLRHPEAAGDAFVVDAFSKGKYLSALSLLVKAGAEGPLKFSDPNRREGVEVAISQAQVRIDARKRAIEQAKEAATGEDAGRPGRARNVEWLEKSLVDLEAEMAELQKSLEAIPADKPDSEHFVAYDLVSMSKELVDNPEILAKTEALKEKYPKLKIAGH